MSCRQGGRSVVLTICEAFDTNGRCSETRSCANHPEEGPGHLRFGVIQRSKEHRSLAAVPSSRSEIDTAQRNLEPVQTTIEFLAVFSVLARWIDEAEVSIDPTAG